jgi:choline dehydrogenase
LAAAIGKAPVPEYDYIVIGAGTAGCVLASRLTEDDGVRVLLVEAGSGDRTRAMTVPNAWPENLGSAADWADITTPQADAGPVPYPSGRTLGGSGAINAMAHVRGHRAVYEAWTAGGATGWGFPDLLPYFRRSERAAGHDPALRGTDGPIPVTPAAPTLRHPLSRDFVAALHSAGYPVTADLSGSQQEGAAWVDLAIADGQRVSAADGYLRPALHRRNLDIETDSLVVRLTVRRRRCEGVTYLKKGTTLDARAAQVILCAGAIGSPQVLMLSGIGPAAQLRAAGIEPLADIAGVGQNLQDHPIAMISYAVPEPLPASAYNHGEAYAALRTDSAGNYPDLHLFPILFPLAPAGLGAPPAGYALVASVVAPDSRGSVRLASADPLARPLIDPGFLTGGHDLDRLTAGLEMIRQVAARPALAGSQRTELWPGSDVVSAAELRQFIRRTVGSYYHPAGTCRMGIVAGAVVDPQLRVHGIAGLRVADASVMPVISNAHPNATVLAIAERAAELARLR